MTLLFSVCLLLNNITGKPSSYSMIKNSSLQEKTESRDPIRYIYLMHRLHSIIQPKSRTWYCFLPCLIPTGWMAPPLLSYAQVSRTFSVMWLLYVKKLATDTRKR